MEDVLLQKAFGFALRRLRADLFQSVHQLRFSRHPPACTRKVVCELASQPRCVRIATQHERLAESDHFVPCGAAAGIGDDEVGLPNEPLKRDMLGDADVFQTRTTQPAYDAAGLFLVRVWPILDFDTGRIE